MGTKIPVADALKKLEAAAAAPNPTDTPWPALTAPPISWSGWKAYVWASAFGDVKEALRAVWDTCIERGLALQAAAPAVFAFPEDHPQAHKGLVITFPRRKTLEQDKKALVFALNRAGYTYGQGKGPVQGAEAVPGCQSLSIRFEHLIDMGRDVDQYEHSILYAPSLPFRRKEVEEMAKALREHVEGQS